MLQRENLLEFVTLAFLRSMRVFEMILIMNKAKENKYRGNVFLYKSLGK